jgi:predicted nucleotidyltransferase
MNKKRLGVLNTLMENRQESFSIRSLAEESGVGYRLGYETVHSLEEFGLIEIEDRGNTKLVRLNQSSPYLEKLEDLAEIDSRPLRETAQEFAEEICERFEEIGAVALFGSVVNSIPTSESDIDVLVLVEEDPEEIRQGVWAVRDRIQREQKMEISPLIMEESEFRESALNNSPLEARILEEAEVLEGELPDG